MPLRYQDLQPGDIVLCYGWNHASRGQFAARALGRLTLFTPTIVRSLGSGLTAVATGNLPTIVLSDPVPYFAGTSKCNHALVVGNPYVEHHNGYNLIDVASLEPKERLDGTTVRTPVRRRADGAQRVVMTTKDGRPYREIPVDALMAGQRGLPEVEASRGKIYLKYPMPLPDVLVPRLCHSTGSGLIWSKTEDYFGSHGGSFAAFRLRADATTPGLIAGAASAAETWAHTPSNAADPAGTHYSTWKAIKAGVSSHIFGADASRRAAIFRQHRATAGGPPSQVSAWSIDPWKNRSGKMDFFCSMFAIAVYHAASADDAQCRTYMPLDARRTSPMMLDGFLRTSDRWQLLGTVP